MVTLMEERKCFPLPPCCAVLCLGRQSDQGCVRGITWSAMNCEAFVLNLYLAWRSQGMYSCGGTEVRTVEQVLGCSQLEAAIFKE